MCSFNAESMNESLVLPSMYVIKLNLVKENALYATISFTITRDLQKHVQSTYLYSRTTLALLQRQVLQYS